MKFRNQFLKYHAPAGDDGASDGSGQGDNTQDPKHDDKQEDGKNKPTEREAALLKETMARKEKITQLETRLKEFEGVDVTAFKTMKERLDALDQQERERSQAKLLEEGKYKEALEALTKEHGGVLEQVRAQSTAELQNVQKERDEFKAQLAAYATHIEDLTIGSAFATSAFIRDELVQAMNPDRSRRLYGDHFDLVDGKVVGYDKPRGQAGRAPLVDKSGTQVPFDEAFKRILATQSDYQSLIRSQAKVGAGSGSRNDKASDLTHQVAPGTARIAAGLAKQGAK